MGTDVDNVPKEMYDDAYDTFKKKQYKVARNKMEAFLKAFPDHKLAGNAQYWIGETFFAEKSYDNSILAYEEVFEKYPKNSKVPAAMLKQAFAFLQLGDKKAAKGILKGIIEKHPKSDVIKAAKKTLKTIDK
jgi:tol-pal system protein YbgF